MSEPPIASRPHIPGYGVPRNKKGLLDWSFAVERLEESKHYWLATTSAGGKPHVSAVWGVWIDGALYFGGGPDVRWVKDLRADPRIVVHLEPADQVFIIEDWPRSPRMMEIARFWLCRTHMKRSTTCVTPHRFGELDRY